MIIDHLLYFVTRPLCWAGFHTYGCRGMPDHFPLHGYWRDWTGRWVRHG